MSAILGLGIYFIVIPAHNSASRVESQIEEKEKQIETARQLLIREGTLDELILEKRERASFVHEGFVGEITHTEAVKLVQSMLDNANYGRGFTAEYGIEVTDIETHSLRVSVNNPFRSPVYALRDFATAFNPEEEEGDVLVKALQELEGILERMLERDWIPALLAAQFALGNDADEEAIEEKLIEFTLSPTCLNLTIVEMLKDRNFLSDEDRLLLLEYMRFLLLIDGSEIGLITAEFTLRLPFDDYLDFLDYLYAYELRIEINEAVLFQDNDSSILFNDSFDETTGLADYEFELLIYVVKPMILPEFGNSGGDSGDEEEAPEEDEQ
jgi:hypothetical protein